MKTGTYYKAVRDNLASFHDREFVYRIGGTHRPSSIAAVGPIRGDRYAVCTDTVLHASSTPSEACLYAWWPWRILEVAGKPVVEEHDKAGFRQLKVIREIPVEASFGALNGAAIVAVVNRCTELTKDEARELAAAWAAAGTAAAAPGAAARDAAWAAAGTAAAFAARDAARAAARAAARDAAVAVARAAARAATVAAARAAGAAGVAAGAAAGAAARAAAVQDLIGQYGFTQEHFDILAGPWRGHWPHMGNSA